tara:strand:- start:126 stop:506 length:381 start_codon:yes stop_codon:yes gene_type:complete
MGKISESINNLIISTSGGILILWAACGWFLIRFLRWCGEKIAQGANTDLVNRLMPSIKTYLDEKMKALRDDLDKDICEIKKGLGMYRVKKHDLEGENANLIEALKSNDPKLMREVVEIYEKRHEKK